tara:strand:- start:929 stop:1324 length:396 start_codon:yes stop_codon:yes gene_type:complete
MAIDARNFATDTKLTVKWDASKGKVGLWRWSVVTDGTVGAGGSLPELSSQGHSTSLKVAIDKGTEKMLQAVPIDVIGAGTTLHRTAAGVIRTGISTLGPTGFVGGRGGWLVTERFKNKTKADIKTSSNVTS